VIESGEIIELLPVPNTTIIAAHRMLVQPPTKVRRSTRIIPTKIAKVSNDGYDDVTEASRRSVLKNINALGSQLGSMSVSGSEGNTTSSGSKKDTLSTISTGSATKAAELTDSHMSLGLFSTEELLRDSDAALTPNDTDQGLAMSIDLMGSHDFMQTGDSLIIMQSMVEQQSGGDNKFVQEADNERKGNTKEEDNFEGAEFIRNWCDDLIRKNE
jgi:hypothetical protein